MNNMLSSNHKIIANTVIQYGKMVVTVIVMLISTRLVLSTLGVIDYGIYNLIYGLVSLLAFLNAAMASSTQRYMSFSFGQNDKLAQAKIFSYGFLLHIILAFLIVGIIEVAGAWLINNKFDIPYEKVSLAILVLHCLAINSFISVVSVPYVATLISRENIATLSIINVVELIFKLISATVLLFISNDKLLVYSLLMIAAPMVSLMLMAYYCYLKYEETRRISLYVSDTKLFKSMMTFASWNFIGAGTSAARSQGVAILMNLFFGVIVNAAYGISNQVYGLINFFSAALMQAIRPQIIKSEGANNRVRAIKLAISACKFMFLICSFFSIPIIVEMDFLLSIWLRDVPQYATIFCQLIIAYTLISQLTQGLQVSIEAVGDIKLLQLTAGVLHLINIPIGYYLFLNGFPAHFVLISIFLEETICVLLRILIAKKIVGLDIKDYCLVVICKVMPIFCVVMVVSTFIAHVMIEGWLRFVINILACCFCHIALIWAWGLDGNEKSTISNLVDNIKIRVFSFATERV